MPPRRKLTNHDTQHYGSYRLLPEAVAAIDIIGGDRGVSASQICDYLKKSILEQGLRPRLALDSLIRLALRRGITNKVLVFKDGKFHTCEEPTVENMLEYADPKSLSCLQKPRSNSVTSSKAESQSMTPINEESPPVVHQPAEDKCPRRKQIRKFKVCYKRRKQRKRRRGKKKC